MKTVDQRIEEVIGVEGGYANHPSDRGGPTKWGITEQVARAYGYRGDMRDLPRATAIAIYKAQYWRSPKFEHVSAFSPAIATELFDTGVNMGPRRAIKMLQRALNGLNRKGVAYPDIAVDGDCGAMTLEALRQYLKLRGAEGEKVMLRALNALQGTAYIELAEADKKQEDFLFGWLLNRVGGL